MSEWRVAYICWLGIVYTIRIKMCAQFVHPFHRNKERKRKKRRGVERVAKEYCFVQFYSTKHKQNQNHSGKQKQWTKTTITKNWKRWENEEKNINSTQQVIYIFRISFSQVIYIISAYWQDEMIVLVCVFFFQFHSRRCCRTAITNFWFHVIKQHTAPIEWTIKLWNNPVWTIWNLSDCEWNVYVCVFVLSIHLKININCAMQAHFYFYSYVKNAVQFCCATERIQPKPLHARIQ